MSDSNVTSLTDLGIIQETFTGMPKRNRRSGGGRTSEWLNGLRQALAVAPSVVSLPVNRHPLTDAEGNVIKDADGIEQLEAFEVSVRRLVGKISRPGAFGFKVSYRTFRDEGVIRVYHLEDEATPESQGGSA